MIRYVDHTYRDYSRYVEDGGELVKHKKHNNNFPAKLHRMLSDPGNAEIIAWLPHGRAWKVVDRDRLITEVIPQHLVGKKYESFTRQLNGWGFKRLHQSGPDFGAYYHECFLRNLPKLTCLIRRLPSNIGKSTPYAEGEPNFYRISEQFPVPPDTSFSAGEHAKRTATEPVVVAAPPRSRALSDASQMSRISEAPQEGSGSTASLKAAVAASVGIEGLAAIASAQAGGQYPYPPQPYPNDSTSPTRHIPVNEAPREQDWRDLREMYARSTMTSSMSCISHPEHGCCPEKPSGAEESVEDDAYEPIPFA
ncbi:hypothetical protein ACHAXT_005249 [Thalassiosira profunda]